MIRPLSLAHILVSSCVRRGDVVIDATVGNGYDTEFLACLVGDSGEVIGFDIQELALNKTRERLLTAGCEKQVSLHLLSHSRMNEVVEGEVCAVMFNLGYLPGGDKSVITKSSESLKALKIATNLLKRGGIITVMAYPGHEGGREECQELEEYFRSFPLSEWSVTKCSSLNGSDESPFLMAVVRK